MLKMTIWEKWVLRKMSQFRTGSYAKHKFQAPEEVYEHETNI